MFMRSILSVLAAVLAATHSAWAAPAAAAALAERDPAAVRITDLSFVSALRPYTFYAAAAYCDPETTLTWNCGANCDNSPDFTPTAAGGDGNGVQYWFTGYDKTLKSVIVSHQGTDPTAFLSVLADLAVLQKQLTTAAFPGIPSGLWVHSGFLAAHVDTRAALRTAVISATTQYNTSSVTFIGHSLGAAIALIDAAYFKTNFPSLSISVKTYGLPRIGNQAFADWVDANLVSLTRVTNTEDPIPIVPGRFLGYAHPSGEIHVTNTLFSGARWYRCPGQDNDSDNCQTGDVPTIFGSNILDHLGPYDGLYMGLCWLNSNVRVGSKEYKAQAKGFKAKTAAKAAESAVSALS